MSISVLLADDHAVLRDGLRFLLESQRDIMVIGDADNGRDAVQRFIELQPDVVLIDIAMPDLNGIEATQQICAGHPQAKVIILSMHAGDAYVFRALEAGARGYLLKESAGTEVVHAVRTVAAGHRYLSQRIADRVIEGYTRWQAQTAQLDPLARLSSRELEILQLVVEGKSSNEIGELLALSPKTVDTYRSRMMEKLGIGDLPGLVKFAIQHGITSLDS